MMLIFVKLKLSNGNEDKICYDIEDMDYKDAINMIPEWLKQDAIDFIEYSIEQTLVPIKHK